MTEAKQLPLFDAVEIQLTKGYTTFVDPIDADLAEIKWYAMVSGNGPVYAKRRLKNGTIGIHRIILSRMLGRALLSTEFVDHKDLNPLNNRRSNLRLATNAQNCQNIKARSFSTSGYKGARLDKRSGRWYSYIRANGKSYYLGSYDTPQEAHAAYCEAAIKYHGEFARFE